VETPNNSTGALFTIDINGYPQSDGPFCKLLLFHPTRSASANAYTVYHVHQFPVPDNGSCLATGEHLDPEGRGSTPPCDAAQPQNCQVGDLSGKHGKIDTLPGFSTQ
jgi:Cu/Zn superoxide dismutase